MKILGRDEAGRAVDFHAPRHTYITSLARAGISPKTVMERARRSTLILTMQR